MNIVCGWCEFCLIGESTYFILLSLYEGARHEYAILKDVQALQRINLTELAGMLGAHLWLQHYLFRQQREVGTYLTWLSRLANSMLFALAILWIALGGWIAARRTARIVVGATCRGRSVGQV